MDFGIREVPRPPDVLTPVRHPQGFGTGPRLVERAPRAQSRLCAHLPDRDEALARAVWEGTVAQATGERPWLLGPLTPGEATARFLAMAELMSERIHPVYKAPPAHPAYKNPPGYKAPPPKQAPVAEAWRVQENNARCKFSWG